ncbi:MAG: hypothetical protein ACI9QD_000779 [Thermoproteota archaeon]|jgi:hypothetical protein
MKKSIVAILCLVSSFAYSSALVLKDTENQTIKVIVHFVYSGPAVTAELAQDSTDEMDQMWNETPTSIRLDGKNYDISFDISYSVANGLILNNVGSCAYNFVQIKDKVNAWDRSFYAGLGSRYAVFFTSDKLGTSTTTAHEYGHGLMLEHDHGDQRSELTPGIMSARGTLVRAQYQWNPAAMAGQAGGTLNPIHRTVRAKDINKIPFKNLIFNEKNYSCLGDGNIQTIN